MPRIAPKLFVAEITEAAHRALLDRYPHRAVTLESLDPELQQKVAIAELARRFEAVKASLAAPEKKRLRARGI